MATKYRNTKTVVAGVTFDSRREAARWQELQLLERAGQIRDLRRQVAFELVPGVKFAGAARARPAIRYFADFVYQERGQQVIEDIKSQATADLPAFKIKRHLMLALHGLDVRVTA